MASAPEFKLDKDDAKELGDAIAGVMKYHHITMTPKQEAYALLIEAAAKVYPPMLLTYVLRKKLEAEKPKGQAAPAKPQPAAPMTMNGATPQTVQERAPAPGKVPQGFDPFAITVPDGSWSGKKN